MDNLQQLRESYARSILPLGQFPDPDNSELDRYVYKSLEAGVIQCFDQALLRFLNACSELRLPELSFSEISSRFLEFSKGYVNLEGMSPEMKQLMEFLTSYRDLVGMLDKAKGDIAPIGRAHD